MGTTLQSLCLRTGDRAEVKARLLGWLSAKGFEPATQAPLFHSFGIDEGGERGLCIFSSDQWVLLLYSSLWEEGDRLRLELTRPEWPILKIWAYDSDIWGYDLFEDGELTASFHSNPRYFGQLEELPLPQNGDPARLCEACKLGPLEAEIERLQRRRKTFMEDICREFCGLIDAEPGGFDYRDIQEATRGEPVTAQLGPFHMEHLRFVARNWAPELAHRPLHGLERRTYEQEHGEAPTPDMEEYRLRLQRFAQIMAVLFLPLAIAFRVYFKCRIWLWKFSRVFDRFRPQKSSPTTPFYDALWKLRPEVVRVDGNTLTNLQHRCRITLSEGAAVGASGYFGVFQFTVADLPVFCEAIRPRDIGNYFRERPHATIRDEEDFFVGDLQARTWLEEQDTGNQTLWSRVFVVQGRVAYYYFGLSNTAEPIPAVAERILRATAESFHLIDKVV